MLGAQAIANEGFLNLQRLDRKHYYRDKTPPFHVHNHRSLERDNQVLGLKEMERAQSTDQLGAQFIGPDGHYVVGGGRYSRRFDVGGEWDMARGGFGLEEMTLL